MVIEGLSGQVLAAHDSDKTVWMTSELPEGGHTVETAYKIAVEDVFGPDALVKYLQEGGLNNRAPIEVAEQLAPANTSLGGRLEMGEALVKAKLAVLLPQVGCLLPDGCRWPRPNAGYPEYWETINGIQGVSTAILSSGHTDFITKSFEVHDLERPDLMLTDDDMRPLMATIAPRMCQKPSRFLMDLLVDRWLCGEGLVDKDADYDSRRVMGGYVVYAGDDVKKDGLLAANAGVQFQLIPPESPVQAYEELTKIVLQKTGKQSE